MAVSFDCPLCHHQRTYTDNALGRAVRCDQCSAKIRIVDAATFKVIDPNPKSPPASKGEPTWQGDAVTAEPATVIPDNVETKFDTPPKKERAKNQTCPMCDAPIDDASMAMGRVRCPKCKTTFNVR
jgi:hypothetical protein